MLDSDMHLQSAEITEHVAFICAALDRHKDAIISLKLSQAVHVQVRILWDFPDVAVVFSFENDVLRQFADVLDSVGISIT